MNDEEENQSSDLSNFIDEHLREIRWASYGFGALSLLVLSGRLKAAKKFTAINQIPSRFITDAYTLQGHVRHVTNEGVLLIDHTPIIELKWIPGVLRGFRKNDRSAQYLNILPAGLELNPDAVSWMKKHVPRKHVWFKMFARDQDALYCDIRVKKSYLGRTSINSALLTQGLCKVKDFQSPPNSDYFYRYLKQMIALEHSAVKKETGMWKDEDSWLKRRSFSLFARGKEKLKRFFRRDKY